MKRPRTPTRRRLSADANELVRLANGLAGSGARLEDSFWESAMSRLIEQMLEAGAEDDFNAALDALFENNPLAHDGLADLIEAHAESSLLLRGEEPCDVLLFAVPLLAWSRFAIPSCPIPPSNLEALTTQLGAHVFAAGAHLSLADYLFSPDQLPRSFVDTWHITQALGNAALNEQPFLVDAATLPETNRFLSDVRYLVGAVAVSRGAPLFRWNEADGSREAALKAWTHQGVPNVESLLAGCAFTPLLADAYHSACRTADRDSRAHSLRASVAFLQTVLGVSADKLRAVVGPYRDEELEEYRIGFGPCNRAVTYHGVVWPLLGNEDENTETPHEIEKILRETGINDIVFHEHSFPLEFCDDCGAPMFPNAEGEAVHAEMPEDDTAAPSQSLH